MNGDTYTLPPVFGTTELERSLLDPQIWTRFESLDQSGKICAEYVWIGGTGEIVNFKCSHHAWQSRCAEPGVALIEHHIEEEVALINPRLIFSHFCPCRC